MGKYEVEIVKGTITSIFTLPMHNDEAPVSVKNRTYFQFYIQVNDKKIEITKKISDEYSNYNVGDEVYLEKRTTYEITDDIRDIFNHYYSSFYKKGPCHNYDLIGKTRYNEIKENVLKLKK